MARLSDLVLRSFAAGELAPGVSARADLGLYQQGVRTCRNFTVQRHGGVANRTGTKYVATVKDDDPQPVLLKFVFNSTQTYVMEFGAGYVRFFRSGAAITVSSVTAWSNATAYVVGDLASRLGVNYYCILAHTNQQPPNATYWYPLTGSVYEIPTPFLANLHLLRATQDLNVVTLTHKDYPPQELVRTADTTWTLTAITTAPSISAPGGGSGVAGAAGSRTFRYKATAVKAETLEESIAGSTITVASAAEPTEAAPITLDVNDVTGAVEYRWYADPFNNGLFGFIGTSATSAFTDAGFAPDYSVTPPQARSLFASTNNYPHTAAYYQQRRVFANTHTNVGTVWASRVGFPSNFSIRSPLQDDDAVTFTPKGPQVLGIQHAIALKRLLLLTDGGEWIVHGDEATGVLTPSTIHPEQEGYAGAAAAPVPVVLGNTVIYTQYLSRVVRDLQLNDNHTGFQSNDLTIYAAHLFVNTVVRMDAQRIPHSVVWCVRDDGVLLGLTYLPESDVYGWHQHDTEHGTFLDVCVVPEGDEHAVYVLVEREIDGDTVTYIERFAERDAYDDDNVDDAVFVDSAITYDGASTDTIDGLDHLEGEVVYAWTTTEDGQEVQGPFTVASGEITLTTEATKAQVGLQITAQLETLPLDVAGTGLRAKRKRVQALTALVESSIGGFYAGPDSSHLVLQRRESWQSSGLVTGLFDVNLTCNFNDEGRVLIQHIDPTPLTVLGLIPFFEVGG